MRLAGGMLLMLGLGACGGRVDGGQTADADSDETATTTLGCPPSDIACLMARQADASAADSAVQEAATSSGSESCPMGYLLCAASCDPPVYRCQLSGLECTTCPRDDTGDASSTSAMTTDGATCGPGEIVCPVQCMAPPETECFAGSKCLPPPPCPP